MDTLDPLLKAVGALVAAGGGIVAITYAIFKKFGEKWLDAKFQERLAAYKHEQQKELEQLRFQVSTLLDRAAKLHQREFDVMPEAWSRLNEALWRVSAFVSPMQSYPDLNAMSDSQLKEFVQGAKLNDWEKSELLGVPDKTRYYVDHIFWHQSNEARVASQELSVYIAKNGLFLPPDIKARFEVIGTIVWEALDEHISNERYNIIPRESAKQAAIRNDAPRLLKELEAIVQGRLWNAERIAA